MRQDEVRCDRSLHYITCLQMEIKVNYVIMRITRISSTILLLSSDGNFLNKYQNDEYFMMDRDYLALQLCHLQTKIYGPGKLPNKVRPCLATAATLKSKVFGLEQQLVR